MLARCVRPLVNKLSGVCRLSKYTQTTGRGLSRGFAQAPANINKAEQKLIKILNQEIEFEEDNYAEDNAVTQYLVENKWLLEENEKTNLIVLKKSSGNSLVQIYFTANSQDFNNENEENEEGENQEKEKDAENPEDQGGDQNITDFNVYISQGKKNVAFECTVVNGEIEINSMNVIDDINAHRLMNPYNPVAVEGYKGPFIHTLEGTLQEALFDLLRSHGINEELAQLIQHVAVDKEQRLYMRWLKELKSFVEQK